ncbi:MAG: hypothetical protein NC489_37870 [Ruminococcus flavefaciens]|nr:hypothetical protein [Ruminococcus flavefaciens]
MQGAKSILPPAIGGRLEDLNGHLTAISRIYTDMAESIALQDKTIRAQYVAQLEAKDKIITDLQAKVTDLQSANQEAEHRAQVAVQEAEHRAQLAVQAAEQHAAEQVAEVQAKLAEANGQLLDQVRQLLATNTKTPTPTESVEQNQPLVEPTKPKPTTPTTKKDATVKSAERKTTRKAP